MNAKVLREEAVFSLRDEITASKPIHTHEASGYHMILRHNVDKRLSTYRYKAKDLFAIGCAYSSDVLVTSTSVTQRNTVNGQSYFCNDLSLCNLFRFDNIIHVTPARFIVTKKTGISIKKLVSFKQRYPNQKNHYSINSNSKIHNLPQSDVSLNQLLASSKEKKVLWKHLSKNLALIWSYKEKHLILDSCRFPSRYATSDKCYHVKQMGPICFYLLFKNKERTNCIEKEAGAGYWCYESDLCR
ncbi:hypothetical protein YC2023_093821 [Brassica napus]